MFFSEVPDTVSQEVPCSCIQKSCTFSRLNKPCLDHPVGH